MTSVVVDGRPLYDGSRHRGLGSYLWSLLSHLPGTGSIEATALVVAGTPVPPGVTAVIVERRLGGRLAQLEHDFRLGADVRASAADVFHSPALSPPRGCDRPWVQTLHDLIPLAFGHPDYWRERQRWRRRARRMHAAAALIADSNHSADDAVRLLDIDQAMIHVAPLGVDPIFEPSRDVPEADPPYLLYVGRWAPHKGYSEAFEAVSRLAGRGYPHHLRVVGDLDVWTDLEVRRLLSLCDRPDRVDLMGTVSQPELLHLYQGAAALLATSRYEGFGLPSLEAMATGTPVVAFDNSATHEIVEGGGVLVPDGDVGAIVDAIGDLIDNPHHRREVADRGVVRAQRFSWARCAEVHATVYASVAS